MSMAVLMFQVFIVGSLYVAYKMNRGCLTVCAIGWGGWTLVMVFMPWLAALQAGVIFFTTFVLWNLQADGHHGEGVSDASAETSVAKVSGWENGVRIGPAQPKTNGLPCVRVENSAPGRQWWCKAHERWGPPGSPSCPGFDGGRLGQTRF